MLGFTFALKNRLHFIGLIRPMFEAASRKYSTSCRAFCENSEYVSNLVNYSSSQARSFMKNLRHAWLVFKKSPLLIAFSVHKRTLSCSASNS